MEKKRTGEILAGLSLALMIVAFVLIYIYVPTEVGMGVVQRIFYIHVPLAWVSFLAFFVVFVSSVLYLWKREARWDILAQSSGEVGLVLTTLFLFTGSVWAKSIWGVWWTWDARLTTSLILWLMYVAYLMVRSFATDEAQGARFAAVVGIVGFLDVPIVALTIVLWRTQHPTALVFEGGLAPSMLLTLLVCLVFVTVLYLCLLALRLSLGKAEAEIRMLKRARGR